MDTFDASQIVAQKTWLDKAIDNVAPSWGLSRLESRVSKALFEYNAARTNRLYSPKKYGQVSESPQTVRDRIIMMWEARDLRENVPEMAAASRCFGINLTPTEYSRPAQFQEADPTRGRRAPGRWRLRLRDPAPG